MNPEIVAYTQQERPPRLRPAGPRPAWGEDDLVDSLAHRCLPERIANAHGWEILAPAGFTAVWSGGARPQDVTIQPDRPDARPDALADALFGHGLLTFRIGALFRTPPGWDLWISGPPNAAKDGAAPLTAIVETDWSPYSFAMNWRLTRPGLPVHFAEGEPICFFFPIQRGAIERFGARIVPIDQNPALSEAFAACNRDAAAPGIARHPPAIPSDTWQRLYDRGIAPLGARSPADHRTRLDPCPFHPPPPAIAGEAP